jgi:hypothetical protein
MAFHFVNLGVDRAPARQLADAVIAGIEGAMVTARALRSPAPFEAVLAVLASHASAVTPKSAARKGANSAPGQGFGFSSCAKVGARLSYRGTRSLC